MKVLIVAVLTLLKSLKCLCSIGKQICLVFLTFQAWSIENIFTLRACANIYSVFVFTLISSIRPGTLLRQFTRLMKTTILLKKKEIKRLPEFFFFNLKKYSLKLKLSMRYRKKLISYFCNILILFPYTRRCIYKSIMSCCRRLCTCLHFPSQCIACFLYKNYAERVHLKPMEGNSMINIVNKTNCLKITMI